MKKVTIELDEREVGRVLNCIFVTRADLDRENGEWFKKESKFLHEIYCKIDNQFVECLTQKEGGEEC